MSEFPFSHNDEKNFDNVAHPPIGFEVEQEHYEATFNPGATFRSIQAEPESELLIQQPSFTNKNDFTQLVGLAAPVPARLQFAQRAVIARAPPEFLEKHSSFTMEGDLDTVMVALDLALKADDRVDFECHSQYQMFGYAFRMGYSIDFRISVYECPAKYAQHSTLRQLVEIHRVFGDRSAFCAFYDDVLKNLTEFSPQQLVSKVPARSLLCLSLPDEPELPLVAEDVLPMLGMASSQYVDVQREGLYGLLSFEANKWNQQVLNEVRADIVEVFQAVLKSEDWEVARCGASLLARVATVPQFHRTLLPFVHDIVRVMQRDSMQYAETRRQLCMGLSLLAQTQSEAIRQFVPMLRQNLQRCADHRLVAHLQNTLNAVSVA